MGLIVKVNKRILIQGPVSGGRLIVPPSNNRISGVNLGGGLTSSPYYDDFESRTVGVTGTTIGSMYISSNTQGGVTIANTGSHSGSRVLRCDYSNFSFPEFGKALQATNRAYQACWIRLTGTSSTVWKFGRFGANTPYGGSPHVAASYTTGGNNVPATFSGEVVTNGSITSYSVHNTATANPATRFALNTWHFYEMEIYTGTVDGSNLYWQERVDGIPTVTIANRPYLTAANPDLITWMISPMDGMGVNTPVVTYLDEMYVDESRARVVLTDAPVYANSTKWSIQPIRDKGNTYVAFNTRKGMFNIGDTGYYHLFDHLGALVFSSNALTVQADVTLP